MPEYDVAERHRILVSAEPKRVFEAVRRVDLSRSVPARVLFGLRRLPALVRREGRGAGGSMTLDDLFRAGFVLLEEDPPVELVMGVVGTFWRPTGGVRRMGVEEFEGFAEPGTAKGTWNFLVTPGSGGRCMVSTETRVRCADVRARRRFLLYWAVVGPFSAYVRTQGLKLIKADAEQHP
jgi:hypothetical protein